MKNHSRLATALGIAAVVLALSASPADAGRGKGRGDKHHRDHPKHHKVDRDHDRDRDRYRHDVVYREVHRPREVRHRSVVHRPYHRPVVRERHFVIPRRIVHRDVYLYDPYWAGTVHYAPHRHEHVIYAFPVWDGYDVDYVPHYYCDDVLYVERHGRYYDDRYERRRPRIGIDVHIGF